MDVTLILAVVAAIWLLAALVAMGVLAWRTFYGNEEMEPGGSMGRQMFGRYKKPDQS